MALAREHQTGLGRRNEPSRLRNRKIMLTRALGAVVFTASFTLVAPTIATASGATGTILRVSGVGRGTLKPGKYSGCLDSNIATNGLIAVNGLVGNVSGLSSDVASWSLDVTERKVGTYKFDGSYTSEPTAELFAAPKDNSYSKVTKDQFFARRGSITVGSGTGSIDAYFMNMAGKTIKVVGSWSCKA